MGYFKCLVRKALNPKLLSILKNRYSWGLHAATAPLCLGGSFLLEVSLLSGRSARVLAVLGESIAESLTPRCQEALDVRGELLGAEGFVTVTEDMPRSLRLVSRPARSCSNLCPGSFCWRRFSSPVKKHCQLLTGQWAPSHLRAALRTLFSP